MKYSLYKSIILAIAIFVFSSATAFASSEYSNEPIPEWVKTIIYSKPKNYPVDTIKNGTYFLCVDSQENPKSIDSESFRRYVQLVVNQKGIRDVSQISITFDPTFQKLKLHKVNISRDNELIDKLKSARISVLQREKDLEAQLYDGRKTLHIILDDIQVGDIVEYSYSLTGQNPVFAGRYFFGVDLQWVVPVQQVSHRLLWPKETKIKIKKHNTSVMPEVINSDEMIEYHFSLENVPGLNLESEIPDWYHPHPWVQYSELLTWEDVIDWGVDLYKAPKNISHELEKKIIEIKESLEEVEDKIVAVLNFVQDEIRYMGIETGVGSYQPSDPSDVFKKRFGDCKDKAFLTVTMLKALGIQSYPAFVNTYKRKEVSKSLPSPTEFDHVIVYLKHEGKSYWFDPTRTYQRGNLENFHQPDYGFALVLDESLEDLVAVKIKERNNPLHEIKEKYDLRKGYNSTVDFEVTTKYRGKLADHYRNVFAEDSFEDLEKRYLNFYANNYKNIQSLSPMTIEDDPVKNEFIIKESYSISDFWIKSPVDSSWEASIYPSDLYTYFEQPDIKQRSMPLSLSHPTFITLKSEVILPDEWNINPENFSVETDALSFNRSVMYFNKVLTLSYEYKTHSDYISADKTSGYLQSIDDINDKLGFTIYDNSLLPEVKFNWSICFIAILVFLIAAHLSFKIYNYQRINPHDNENIYKKPDRIGGWLILLSIGLIIHPFKLAYEIFDGLDTYSLENWNYFTMPGSEDFHFLWHPILLFELTVNIFWLVFSCLILVLFFQKRKSFPEIFIPYMIFGLVIMILDCFLVYLIPSVKVNWEFEIYKDVIKQGIYTFIWSLYFMKSKRVKRTFTRLQNGPVIQQFNQNVLPQALKQTFRKIKIVDVIDSK